MKKIILIVTIVFTNLLAQEIEKLPLNAGLYDIKEVEIKPKSVRNSLMLSMLLPGTGHWYVESKFKAKLFWVAEGVIWGGYIGFTYHGRRVRDDYNLYAATRAGANSDNHSEEYYSAMEQYLSSEDYNTDMLREARILYPDDPQKQQEYLEQNGYFGNDEWDWGEESNWRRYKDLRTKSREAFQRAIYMTAFALLNRGLASIDAVRETVIHNKKLQTSFEILPQLNENSQITGVGVWVCIRFN